MPKCSMFWIIKKKIKRFYLVYCLMMFRNLLLTLNMLYTKNCQKKRVLKKRLNVILL